MMRTLVVKRLIEIKSFLKGWIILKTKYFYLSKAHDFLFFSRKRGGTYLKLTLKTAKRRRSIFLLLL